MHKLTFTCGIHVDHSVKFLPVYLYIHSMGSCIYYSVYIVHWGGVEGGRGQLASIHIAGAGVRMSMHVLVRSSFSGKKEGTY